MMSKYVLRKNAILGILFLCFSGIMHSQDSSEELERQQRAIFIFNFTQQIIWPSDSEKDVFSIGVMGADPTIANVNQMAQKRLMFGKPIRVKRINKLSDIRGVDVIYVHTKYNFNVNSILKEIKGKSILLITEGYSYNASMINMVRTDGTYKYEINKRIISSANLNMTSSLEEYAVSSIDKWQELYKNTEKKLSAITEENEQQKEIIEQQQEEIGNQQEAIVTQQKEIEVKEEVILEKDYSIQNLSEDSELKNIALQEKINLEKELEKNIQKQIEQLKTQEEKIEQSKKQIEQQRQFLEYQNADILEKETILEKNTKTILNQKRTNQILILLLFFLGLASLWIFYSKRKSKRLNKLLKKQHTDIKNQSEQLAIKNKELEQFAYIASHDLQEPLSTVSSFIELLESDYREKFDSDGKEILNFIKEGSIRMKKLIDALLQYSRLGRDQDFKTVNCNIILKELKADLKTVIEKNNVLIETRDFPIVKGNDVELRLLFQNLISNAIKFRLPEVKPRILIDCIPLEKNINGEVKKYWQFSVKDNGIGIAEEYQDRIFGIFQRLHSREEYKGSGIGLAHCEKIVKSHGGDIWLESQKGKGSIFYFTIPA